MSAFFVYHAFAQIPPGYYNPSDIAVINSLIENNGLKFTKAEPSDGSYIPDDWIGIGWSWNTDMTNFRIQNLYLQGPLRMNNQEVAEGALTGDIDLTGLTRLQWLDITSHSLNSLNVSGLTELNTIKCLDNNLVSLDISGLYLLQTLDCSNNKLNTLNVAGLNNLQTLNCSSNYLVSIDVSGLSELFSLNVMSNGITSLDLSNLKKLASLECSNFLT